MNKFARWLGNFIESLKWHYKAGGVDFHESMIGDSRKAEVIALVRQAPKENYIPAIKLYREHFGVGLKEAKDAVDVMRAQIGYVRASY